MGEAAAGARWDGRFLRLARLVSTWSKDPSTRIGAVLVRERRVVSTGYNGLPRGLDDGDPRWKERPAKYLVAEHAERNAVYNAAMHGVATLGCGLYVFGMRPCSACARAAVQSGVSCITCGVVEGALSADAAERWSEDWDVAQAVLDAAGVPCSVFAYPEEWWAEG